MKKNRWLRRQQKRQKQERRRLRLQTEGNSKQRRRSNRSPGDYTYRAGYTDRHHITNKMHNGTKTADNLLRMDRHRHNALHLLFGNMDFLQITELLIRCLRIKNHPDFYEAEYILEEFQNEKEDKFQQLRLF